MPGLACLNFTKPSTVSHHVEWAAEENMPAPSDAIMAAGVIFVAGGLCTLTVAVIRRPTAA